MNTLVFSEYPAYCQLNPEHGVTIHFRNWKEKTFTADNLEQAKSKLYSFLVEVLNQLSADCCLIPKPEKALTGDLTVEVPLDVQLKILLLNCMQKNRYRKSDLAKDLNIPPQRISSFLSFKKTTNLDFFDRAFRVMGRRLTFSI